MVNYTNFLSIEVSAYIYNVSDDIWGLEKVSTESLWCRIDTCLWMRRKRKQMMQSQHETPCLDDTLSCVTNLTRHQMVGTKLAGNTQPLSLPLFVRPFLPPLVPSFLPSSSLASLLLVLPSFVRSLLPLSHPTFPPLTSPRPTFPSFVHHLLSFVSPSRLPSSPLPPSSRKSYPSLWYCGRATPLITHASRPIRQHWQQQPTTFDIFYTNYCPYLEHCAR